VRVLATCSLGGAGHLHPLLPLLAAAHRRGDEILVVGPPALEALVEVTGHRFVAGAEPPEDHIAPIRERMAVAAPEEASILANCELFGRLATAAMLPTMQRVCSDWRPDLILREPCEYASAVVATDRGFRVAQVAISLAEVELASIRSAAPALEAQHSGIVDVLRTTPYLTRFPASIDPSPFSRTYRFNDARRPSPGRLGNWWRDAEAPLVYVSLGTVLGHMSIAAKIYETVLAALAPLSEVRVLLTVGKTFDPAVLSPVADNVHVEAWVDQNDALATADVVVCHGGSGTAFGALEFGVPLVMVPVFADQFENGRRIAECGAGEVVLARQTTGADRRVIDVTDAARITDAVTAVLSQPGYRRCAARLASETAAEPSADDMLGTIAPATGARG